MEWNKVEILSSEMKWLPRKIKEAVQIRTSATNTGGQTLSPLHLPLLNSAQGQRSTPHRDFNSQGTPLGLNICCKSGM